MRDLYEVEDGNGDVRNEYIKDSGIKTYLIIGKQKSKAKVGFAHVQKYFSIVLLSSHEKSLEKPSSSFRGGFNHSIYFLGKMGDGSVIGNARMRG